MVGGGNEILHHYQLCLNFSHELYFGVFESGFKIKS